MDCPSPAFTRQVVAHFASCVHQNATMTKKSDDLQEISLRHSNINITGRKFDLVKFLKLSVTCVDVGVIEYFVIYTDKVI